MLKKMLSLTLAAAFASLAVADEADIKKAMEARLGAKVESVSKSGYLGLYEVYADGAIFYTDDKVSAIVVGGQMIDAKSMKNVTDERMKKLTAIRFSDLPLDRAIKQVRGDGKRVLATFEDPNCGYCKPPTGTRTGPWRARCRATAPPGDPSPGRRRARRSCTR